MNLDYRIPLLINATVTPVEDLVEFESITNKLTEDKEHIIATAGAGDLFTELSADRAPIIDGKPRMLHVQAVIVHEGVNGNGDGFYKEDLISVVSNKRLFQNGFGGMIDINHNFQPIGYWYTAEVITDPQTDSVAILAKGAIWAWRFPEAADMMLANQHRDGKIDVSMTCMCLRQDLEYKRLEDGRTVAYHKNPVFIATTILNDMPPGDAFARGHADEDPRQLTENEMKDLVLKAAQRIAENQILEEYEMSLDELKPLLEEKFGRMFVAI